METKKLKKLSINKMQGFPVIEEQEQMALKGGGPFEDIFKWVLADAGLSESQMQCFFKELSDKIDAIGDKIGDVAEKSLPIITNIAGEIFSRLIGGPLNAPLIILDNPQLIDPTYGQEAYGTEVPG